MKYKSTLKAIEHEALKKMLEAKDKRVVFDKTNIIPDHRNLMAE